MNNLQELLSVYQENEQVLNIFLNNGVKLKGIISDFGACQTFGAYILFQSLTDSVQVIFAAQVATILPAAEAYIA